MTRCIEDRIASLEANVADHEKAIYNMELARSKGEQVLYDIASLWMSAYPEGAAWPTEDRLRMAWGMMMHQFRAAGVRPLNDENTVVPASRSAR
jgi:hypothetical protein